MNDRIKCPKCNQLAFVEAKYYIIRDQFIRFTGNCLNCGYEVTPEEVFNELKTKFDFNKDFEHLEKPLEFILDRTKSTDEETRKQILQILIRSYEEKAKDAWSEEEFEKLFNKAINCQQALEGRTLSGSELLLKKGRLRREKDSKKAIEYFEKAFEQGDSNKREIAGELWQLYELQGEYDKAIEFLDFGYAHRARFPEISKFWEHRLYNLYLQQKGELLFEKGFYQEALQLFEQIKYKKEIIDSEKEGYVAENRESEEYFFELMNLEAMKLAFCAAYKAKKYDIVKSVLSKIQGKDPLYFGVEYPFSYDTESVYYFLCLIEYFLETDQVKAYETIKNSEVVDEKEVDWFREFEAYLFFLKGKVFMTYALTTPSRENQKILSEAKDYFEKSIATAKKLPNFDPDDKEWIDEPPFYEGPVADWVHFFGKFEKIVPEAHRHIGEIYEALGDKLNAFYEYKKAEELNLKFNNPEDRELKNKKDNLSKIFLENFKKEAENLAKIESKEISLDTTKRIISLLDSIKNSFPEHYEKTKQRVELYGKELPHDLLNPLRITAEEFFNKIYENKKSRKKKSTENYFKELMSKIFKKSKSKDFLIKVEEMRKRDIINSYIENLLRLIWSIGSKGSHPPPKYVKEFKLEDIEVIISAVVTFLRWYSENIQKQK